MGDMYYHNGHISSFILGAANYVSARVPSPQAAAFRPEMRCFLDRHGMGKELLKSNIVVTITITFL